MIAKHEANGTQVTLEEIETTGKLKYQIVSTGNIRSKSKSATLQNAIREFEAACGYADRNSLMPVKEWNRRKNLGLKITW